MKHFKLPGWSLGVIIGILFLGMGFLNGQFNGIFQKAVLICLECIGIG